VTVSASPGNIGRIQMPMSGCLRTHSGTLAWVDIDYDALSFIEFHLAGPITPTTGAEIVE
jgi:hypothetical protein